ncbi:putative ABC transport system ATP-binding protein [Gracilibacillus halotolerans]|uniref:Putative ABC transport system ATP-binding protein n=1 Tax=Gracilibacillus halotolerans TaxID=74386 RepID=A0A841RNC3_9BACI|nr:ABC transporter ATP-binding protein [Gracilibacillus halotolerans]MBB6514341.1 putative ABC transport system ATP-binding protein [Gracilibacillus halotolerans]
MPNPILQASNITRSFGSGKNAVHALRGINLTITESSLIILKGKSGSGKTTFMNILGGLDQPTDGTVTFLEQDISQFNHQEVDNFRKKHVGFIFQAFALLPMMTAIENVEFSLRIAGVPQEEWEKRIKESLEWVGLSKRAKHRPYELSGGEQQRVAIARAIAKRPSLILADEPTAELDSKRTFQIIRLFRSLVDEQKMTIIFTTHDPNVLHMADTIYELEDGQLIKSKLSS